MNCLILSGMNDTVAENNANVEKIDPNNSTILFSQNMDESKHNIDEYNDLDDTDEMEDETKDDANELEIANQCSQSK